ncbi:MAG TPA: helix-turn-helix transcriptional regulator [Oscillospiraceae bacterium]|nr:helix-turn-helix transcriptional regulator [Oscillospiraceae bacterium]
MQDNITIGRKLKIYRLCIDMTRKQVADKLGLCVSTIAMYEQGARRPPDHIKLKYAELFRSTVQDLFYE